MAFDAGWDDAEGAEARPVDGRRKDLDLVASDPADQAVVVGDGAFVEDVADEPSLVAWSRPDPSPGRTGPRHQLTAAPGVAGTLQLAG